MTDERHRISFHEAGHAVAAHVLGWPVEHASINDHDGMTRLARNRIVWLGDRQPGPGALVPDAVRRPAERAILMFLAGPAAERLAGYVLHYAASIDGPAGTDHDEALDLATWVVGHEEAAAYLGWLEIGARALVYRDAEAIARVAEALLERDDLTGDAVAGIIDPLLERSKADV